MTRRREYRPFPNVVQRGRGFAAFQPQRRFNKYLGVYPTAEEAAAAVLTAQAEHLESKARAYRDRAAALTTEKRSA